MAIEGSLLYSGSDHYLVRITDCYRPPDKSQTQSAPVRRDRVVMFDR